MEILKNILITGNLGYVGPIVENYLANDKSLILYGLDIEWFKSDLTSKTDFTSCVKKQTFKDIRNIDSNDLEGIDTIVHLAAVSNDPMGNDFEQATYDINLDAGIKLAKLAKNTGVKNFIFASSCSVYGAGGNSAKKESDRVNPLTAYAISKVKFEEELKIICEDGQMIGTALRFSTACGPSSRVRLDLVLNDFVASAIENKRIDILSDGSPFRPLIDTRDMARAIYWAINRRDEKNLVNFISVNIGMDKNNMSVREIANCVKNIFPEVNLSMNENASPDKRSYKVNFDLFKKIAPNFQPLFSIQESAKDLADYFLSNEVNLKDFRAELYIRHNKLKRLKERSLIGSDLAWIRNE